MPVAVCGDKEQRHGIVLAKNEAAKRCGVKTAEAIFEAKAKCPELVILPPMMDKYKEYSEKAHRIYEEYTDMISAGIVDPTKVTRSALENASSVAAMVLTTESLVSDIKEDAAAANAAAAAAQAGGMY